MGRKKYTGTGIPSNWAKLLTLYLVGTAERALVGVIVGLAAAPALVASAGLGDPLQALPLRVSWRLRTGSRLR